MMDVEFWIYIIVGVIYFLSRLLKKGEEVTSETPPAPPTPRPGKTPVSQTQVETARETQRPLTFEELLREITEGKQIQRPQPEPQAQPKYERNVQERAEEARSLEDISIDEEASVPRWKPYEEVPVYNERTSLEETLRLEDTVVEFRKFDAFQQREEKKVSDAYMKMLRNPETLKQAVVISEILKRKF